MYRHTHTYIRLYNMLCFVYSQQLYYFLQKVYRKIALFIIIIIKLKLRS